MKLSLRLTRPGEVDDDWTILADGNQVGRIRYAPETHSKAKWFWCFNAAARRMPPDSRGWAWTLEEAKVKFRAVWDDFEAATTPEELEGIWKAARETDRRMANFGTKPRTLT